MLKRTWWIGERRALHSTAAIVTASARAARGPNERGAGERADGADGDRAVVDLERERLPRADERDHGEQADPCPLLLPKIAPTMPAPRRRRR